MEFKLEEEKIKPFDYLLSRFKEKNRDLELPKFCFLLGAGCSVSSGIPAGGGIIELCKKISFAIHNGADVAHCWTTKNYNEFEESYDKYASDNKIKFEKYVEEIEKGFEKNIVEEDVINRIPKNIKDNFDKRLSDIELNKKLYEEFKKFIFKDSLYGKWFAKFNESAKDRQELIESIIEDKKPTGVYIFFAELIKRDFIHNIFTTNFDDLLNEALLRFSRVKARVYAHNEIAKYISTTSRKVNIIKLHGDYLFENIKNINEETSRLEENMKHKMKEMLNHFCLIVTGYGGADDSIMSTIEEIKSVNNNLCLIWCGSNSNKLNWRVINLLNNNDNSFFIEIEDFDTFVFKLWNDISGKGGGGYINLKKNYEEDENDLKEFYNKYFKDIETKKELSQEEREKASDISKIFDIFEKADEEKNIDKKIELYTMIMEIDSNCINAYNDRGNAYSKKKEYDKAIEDYTKAIDLNPDYDEAYFKRGSSYYNWGLEKYDKQYFNKSILDYSKVIDKDQYNAVAYDNRGVAYIDIGEYDKAISDLTKAIELKPNFTYAYNNRGSAYAKNGDNHKALLDFTKAIELDPNFALAYCNRGFIYYSEKEYDKAILNYKEAIRSNPDDATGYINLIELSIVLKNYGEAQKNIKNVYLIELNDKEKAIIKYFESIMCKIRDNNINELDKEFNKIIKKDFWISYSFNEIENWLKDAKLSEDIKKYIREKTELLKRKIKE